MSLLQMSFAGGVMILAITVIRTLAINRLPKKTFLALWGIAVVRLLLPFSFPSVFSVYSLLGSHVSGTDVAESPLAVALMPVEVAGQKATMSTNIISVWVVVWAAGALIFALVFGVAYWKCRQEFQTSFPVENAFIRSWLNKHQQKRPISVRQSSRFSAPLTYGVFHPVILMQISTKWANTKSLLYVLEHEYVHIRRFDSMTKLVLIATVCVHWFNPLVWVMYILVNRDIELSCDEAVVHLFGENTRAAYARTLISMEETRSGFAPLCSNFSKNAIEERITAIMKIKKASIFSLVLALALVCGVTTAFATSANAQQADPVEQNDNINIVGKPASAPQIADTFGTFFKDDGKTAGFDTSEALMATPVQSGDIYGAPVDKTDAETNGLPDSNVIYFDTEAQRDEHFRALDANTEKGLNRYAGFETMYAGIDTSAPITYIVK